MFEHMATWHTFVLCYRDVTVLTVRHTRFVAVFNQKTLPFMYYVLGYCTAVAPFFMLNCRVGGVLL